MHVANADAALVEVLSMLFIDYVKSNSRQELSQQC